MSEKIGLKADLVTVNSYFDALLEQILKLKIVKDSEDKEQFREKFNWIEGFLAAGSLLGEAEQESWQRLDMAIFQCSHGKYDKALDIIEELRKKINERVNPGATTKE